MPPHKKSFAAEQLALRQQNKVSPVVWVLVGVVVVALIVGGYVMYRKSVSQKQDEAPQIKSIAVLAFEDMTQEKNMEHLGDGMAEALITALSTVDSLRVPARNSTFVFKGKYHDMRDIGSKLDVDAVLEGSIQTSGSKLRITAQLIRVKDDYHLWSEQYNYSGIENAFAIQDSISLAILREMKFTLMGKEKAEIVKRHTHDPDAWDLYLKGRLYWYKRIPEDHKKALECFNQAINKDPNFALAYVGIADVYNLYDLGLSKSERYSKRRAAVEKALELDESLAEAHTSLAWIKLKDWDWPGAEKEFKRALALNPTYAQAHVWYHDYFCAMGRLEEALESMKRAKKYDPLNVQFMNVTGRCYLLLGRYEEAEKEFSKSAEIDPDFILTSYFQSMLDREMRNYQAAIDVQERFLQIWPNRSRNIEVVGYTYAVSGDRLKAEQIIEELKEQKPVPSCGIAFVYTGLGENSKALDWLEKAYEDSTISFVLKSLIEFKPLHTEPRFKDLLKKMGLPED